MVLAVSDHLCYLTDMAYCFFFVVLWGGTAMGRSYGKAYEL